MARSKQLKTMQLINLPCRLVYKKSRGFSLIEMIVVIVILGVLATGISTFVGFGTQVYTDATDREKVVSSARFAIERLNRELRNALPNSICLTDTLGSSCDEDATQCLKFTPIIEATTYVDIPVSPDNSSDTIRVIKFTEKFNKSWNATVYPLTPEDADDTSSKTFKVLSLRENLPDSNGNEWEIEFDGEIRFEEHSPTQRIYFTGNPMSYCLTGGELRRNGVLMAEFITNGNPFTIENASLQRNAIVQVYLKFEINNEAITFNNEIQVLNVP